MLAHCLATRAVHIVEVPINYAAGAALQVWALPTAISGQLEMMLSGLAFLSVVYFI